MIKTIIIMLLMSLLLSGCLGRWGGHHCMKDDNQEKLNLISLC